MPSASTAIAAIATALPVRPPVARSSLGEFEFPTMAHVWLAQQRRGAAIVWAPARRRRRCRSRPTPRASTSARCSCRRPTSASATATASTSRRWSPLCRERGALRAARRLSAHRHRRRSTCTRSASTSLVTGALKYLLGPAGVAFLYVRRDADRAARAAGRPAGSAASIRLRSASTPLDWASSARRFEAGTPPVPNAYAAAAGLELLQSRRSRRDRRADQPARRALRSAAPARAASTWRRRRARAARTAGRGARDRRRRAGRRLEARGIIASARGTGLRVSFHAYNTDGDVDAVLDALDANAALIDRDT